MDTSRHDQTRLDESRHLYRLSLDAVAERLNDAGIPRNIRTITRWCNSGRLAALKTETPNGEQWFVSEDSVVRAIEELHGHRERKAGERQRFEKAVAGADLNARQQTLLIRALKDPTTEFTYQSHANSHGIVVASARSDLLDLERRGLLKGHRAGRRFRFFAAPDLSERLTKSV